jgi:hypothetical protein
MSRWSARDLADWYRRWAEVAGDPVARAQRTQFAIYLEKSAAEDDRRRTPTPQPADAG